MSDLERRSIDEMRKQIAYVPQRSNIDWNFPIIVRDTVLLGTYPKVGLLRRPKKADKEWAMECLRQVGMEEFANRQIGELSGGQQQRVFLARALAQKADYFFLDEPFVGIDVSSEEVIIDILRQLKNAGKIVFVVHHDLSKVKSYFDELVLINKELIDAGPVNKVFQRDNMAKAYQRRTYARWFGGFNVMDFIHDLMTYGFLQKAFVTSIMVGIICGVIGCFIVLRGMALMGDAISHAVLPGVAISYMLGINYFYGAVATGILTAFGIGAISQNSRIKNDSSIGLVFSAFFALGIILITKAGSATDLTQILFGNVLSVRTSDMWLTLIIGAVVILVVVLFFKELLVSSFDETMAAAYGLKTRFIHYTIMFLLTLVTVASLQTVGVILVVSMLITPASTAYLLTNRLSVMVVLAAFFGALSSVIGLYFSFLYNLPSGPVIALATTSLFLLAFLFAPKQGIVSKKIRTMGKRKVATPPLILILTALNYTI